MLLPPICDATVDWPAEATAQEDSAVEAINEARSTSRMCEGAASQVAQSLTHDPRTRCAARLHALDMVARDYDDTTTPEGVGTGGQLDSVGRSWTTFGGVVNTAPTGEQTVDELLDGSLCEVLLDPSYSLGGAAVSENRWAIYFASP